MLLELFELFAFKDVFKMMHLLDICFRFRGVQIFWVMSDYKDPAFKCCPPTIAYPI